MDNTFQEAVEKVLDHEGGYVNDRDDPGGETKFGISKRSYPDLDIKNLSRKDAVEIYHRDWWEKYGYGEIHYKYLAMKVFDLSVNMGPAQAHKILQRAVNKSGGKGVSVDGILGPLTLDAINRHLHQEFLFAEFKLGAVEFYVHLNKPKYLAGWVKRALA